MSPAWGEGHGSESCARRRKTSQRTHSHRLLAALQRLLMGNCCEKPSIKGHNKQEREGEREGEGDGERSPDLSCFNMCLPVKKTLSCVVR